MLPTIETAELACVIGGAGSTDIPAFGRCGPADKWQWLGNVSTPACAAHDASVRTALERGASKLSAHVQALPLLPAAVGSYVRERFGGASA